jgi:hypothetical protein
MRGFVVFASLDIVLDVGFFFSYLFGPFLDAYSNINK